MREIEHLAHGYFRGPEALREQIRAGNVALPLEQMKRAAQAGRRLHALRAGDAQGPRDRPEVPAAGEGKSRDRGWPRPAFRAQAQLLLAGLLSRAPAFLQSVRELHDRCGQA